MYRFGQWDLFLMTLVIFLPAIFAVALLFIPKRLEEVMRWIALIGTAFTLVASLFLLVDHWKLQDENSPKGNLPRVLLSTRADFDREADTEADKDAATVKQTDLVARRHWINQFNIDYYLGIDGISLPLIVLTTLIFFLSMIASWKIDRHVRGYCILFLLLETGVLGTFMALDFFLFFVFWEVMLLPMYFLIGIWGGPRREYAAVKFFLYTMLGSVFILIAILGFYFTNLREFATENQLSTHALNAAHAQNKDTSDEAVMAEIKKKVAVNTFDIMTLHKVGRSARIYLSAYNEAMKGKKGTEKEKEAARNKGVAAIASAGLIPAKGKDLDERKKSLKNRIAANESNPFSFFSSTGQIIFFIMLFVGFAIKVPVFPFHTWLPDAHVEAPTPISMILAGILLKLGGYGILRIAYPICPYAAETLAWYLALFGIISIVYGALAAMAQKDFKKLVAYSSISHMGYVILGIAVWQVSAGAQYWSWGMNGAMYQMIAHGVSSAGMFFLVGVIYDRAHHRNLDNFRGLNEPMPLYGGISALIFFAALGLPGLCGFVGEFFVVLATWNYDKVFAVIAALTVVVTAAYILWTLQRVYFGTNPAYKDYSDISFRELLCIIPLCVLAVLLGIVPWLILSWMEPSVTGLVHQLAQMGQ